MNESFKPASYFVNKYGCSASTLRNWGDTGKIETRRFKSGKRFYNTCDAEQQLGVPRSESSDENSRLSYIYARVSSQKQSEDLGRQIEELTKAYPKHTVIKDIGSGINFKRKGLRTLLDLVNEGLVREVVVMYRDRLARFGIDLLEYIFKQKGVKFLVHSQDASTEPEDILAADLLAITTVFVASHHGKRAGKNRKRRRTDEEETQTVTVKVKEGVQETSPRQDN